MSDVTAQSEITYLRSAAAIRDRCGQLFALACENQLRYFSCDLSQLDRVADYVIQVTRDSYPDRAIPFHSRWRHFEVGDRPRLADLEARLAAFTPIERLWAKWDLAIVSVLLDAGAGSAWRYREHQTGTVFTRSEGLAIASFDAFCAGLFSSNPTAPLQVDAIALQHLTAAQLEHAFQVNSENPLVGLSGRVQLLNQLGKTLQARSDLFGDAPQRPGYLAKTVIEQASVGAIAAHHVFSAVLDAFSTIWPGRVELAGVNLGDVWPHPALSSQPPLVPFHKLSQWLTYSLLEPLQDFGLAISSLDALTGLPEYRNGGLCLDLGLLTVRDAEIFQQVHVPSAEVIVEWRALTVVLLDRIAAVMRQKLHLSAAELPLVKVLQGGTWTAGRRIAAELRPGGVPPIQIDSDGTVF